DPLCVHPITVSACCAEVDTELIDGRTFLVRSRSVVEPIAVGQGGERACVDLDNDNAPEVVVRDAAGARLSVATGPPSNIRFAASIAMNETPQSMLAMSWFDGMKPRPILVGQFQTSPFLRLASPAGWAANEWAPRPTSVTGAHDWVPVAPSRDAGASYLAVRQGFTAIAFACVSPGSPGCRADATTIDIADIDMGPIATPQRVVGFTVADFDGDLDLDLVVAVDDMVPVVTTRPVKMYAYDLRWNGHEIESHSEPTAFSVASTGVAWTALQFATLPYADGDLIYLLATGGLTTAFVEISTCALGCRTSRVVHSIGRPYRIATVGNTLFAATELGIWELENGQSWIPRDPERMRTQGTTIPAPDPSSPYGQQLESCLVADPLTPPSILFDAEAGARWAFANVQVGTLPGP
ncbi:MAG: hypothetical protein ACKV2T_38800, partial [Kofleriaceae bacterium]